MISQYDVEIDQDGDGATLVGTVTINGTQRKLVINGAGRDLGVELDGESCPDELAEELGRWTEPFNPVQETLDEHDVDSEDWSARVVNGKVVRLLVLDGRGVKVLVGKLTDLTWWG